MTWEVCTEEDDLYATNKQFVCFRQAREKERFSGRCRTLPLREHLGKKKLVWKIINICFGNMFFFFSFSHRNP